MQQNPFHAMAGTMHPRNVAVPQHMAGGFAPHANPAMMAAAHHAIPAQMPAGPQLQAMAHMAGPAGVTPDQQMAGRIGNPFHRPAVGQGLRNLGSLFG